jgi:5-methylthioadenosine/S-adenosylhomocysteine deaminase
MNLMKTSLIRGKYVISKVTGRDEVEMIEDGAVAQQGGRIVAIGKEADLRDRFEIDAVIGSAKHVVLPGLINSHHHVGLTPVQLGSRDYPLELWFATLMGFRTIDPYLDTLYSAFEMIESGVTTVHHIQGWLSGPTAGIDATVRQILKAYSDVGMRVTFSYMIRDQNRLVYEDDERFTARLPADLGRELSAHLAAESHPVPEQLGHFEDLYQRHIDDERIGIQLAPANLHWCSDEALKALQGCAEKFNVPLHMHFLETAYQKEYARRRLGDTSPIEHLRELGLLNDKMTLGHALWVTERDIEMIAEAGAHVCTNASSNLRLRSGIAPVNAYQRHGVRVAIGIDEAGINDDRDMLQEMRMVLNLHRTPGMDDVVPSSAEVLRMATEHGAHTTAFGDDIGTLEVGKAADLLLLDLDAITYPFQEFGSDVSLVDVIIHRGRRRAVDTVVVAGEVVYGDGVFTRVDRCQALADLAASLDRPMSADETRRRRLGERIFPHVKAFYDGYLDGQARDPFYQQNSRH